MGSKRFQVIVLLVTVVYALPSQAEQADQANRTQHRNESHGQLIQIPLVVPQMDVPMHDLADMPMPPESDPIQLLVRRYGPERAMKMVAGWNEVSQREINRILAEQQERLKAAEARLAELERIEKQRQERLRRMRLARRRAAARQAELARLAELNTARATANLPSAMTASANADAPKAEAAAVPTPQTTTAANSTADQAAQMGADNDNLVIQLQQSGPQQIVLDLSLPNTETGNHPPRVWVGNLRQVTGNRVLEITVKVTANEPETAPVTKPEPDVNPLPHQGDETSSLNRPPLAPSSPLPAPLPHDPGQRPDPDSSATLPYDTAAAAKRQLASNSRYYQWLTYASHPMGPSGLKAGLNPTASWIKRVSRRLPKRGQQPGEAPAMEML